MGTLDMSHLININKEKGWALLNHSGVSIMATVVLKEPILPHVAIGHLLITLNIRQK